MPSTEKNNIIIKIVEVLDTLKKGKIPAFIDLPLENDEMYKLVHEVNELIIFFDEIQKFILPLSKGILNQNVPPTYNFLSSPFKELNSRLMQITYQAEQVSRGDYSQRVDFLGEFSKAFNNMVVSLEQKDKILREKEERERLLREQLQLALDTANLVWWECDLDLGVLIFDEKRPAMLGYSLGEFPVMLDEIKNLIYKDDIKILDDTIEKARKSENKKFYVEYRIKSKTGEYRWHYATGIIEQTSNPESNKITGILSDIHNQKTYEDKLKASEKILRDSNAAKTKLFSILSHDLRGPIGSIFQLLDLLVEQPQVFKEDEKGEMLISLRNSAKTTYELLNDLLMWTNTQSKNINLNPQNFNVSKLLEEIKNIFKLTCEKKNIDIEINCSPQINIFGDIDSVKIILRNLLSNALKFSRIGGTIKIDCIKENDFVNISIKDNGIGIPEDKQANIFQLNIEKSQEGTMGEKGTGLGLSLCKEFAELNGGDITFESKVNVGTTFTAKFPAAK